MSKIVGIDLGTTRSAVGIMEGGRPSVIPSEDGSLTIPSLVLFTPDQKIYAGHRAVVHPGRYHSKNMLAHSFKRMMGKDRNAVWGYLKSSPQEVSAFILDVLRRQAESHLGDTVEKAVISVPAHFDVNQRQATKEAAIIAGIEPVWLLNEANAALLAYAHNKKARDQKVVVCDLGGGTLDVVVAECGGGVFEVLCISGDSMLGGSDFDQEIVNLALEQIKSKLGASYELDSFQKLFLKETAEKVKLELDTSATASIQIPGFLHGAGKSADLQLIVDRATYHKKSKHLSERIVEIVSAALEEAGVKKTELGTFLMVGGASRAPFLRDLIRTRFGIEPITGGDPKLCVVHGATIMASVLLTPA